MLARQISENYGQRVRFVAENFGDSSLARRFGVKRYPAVFIDDVLVATPRDFFTWGAGHEGRYTPWLEASSRRRFQEDLSRLIDLRLRQETLQARSLTEADRAVAPLAALPDLVVEDLQGETLRSADLLGSPTLVEFWATWCPPCHGTLEWLATLGAKHAGKLSIVTVAVQSDTEEVHRMLEAAGVRARTVVGTRAVTEAFGGMMAVPTLFLFDGEGKLVTAYYGAPPALSQRVEEELERLLGGAERATVVLPDGNR